MENVLLQRLESFGAAQSSTPCGRAAFVVDRIAPLSDELPGLTRPHAHHEVMEVTPATGIRENDELVALHVELPGVAKDDVRVVNEGNMLLVEARRARAEVVAEQSCTVLYRARILVPGNVDLNQLKARFENGALSIEAPKRRGGRPLEVE